MEVTGGPVRSEDDLEQMDAIHSEVTVQCQQVIILNVRLAYRSLGGSCIYSV